MKKNLILILIVVLIGGAIFYLEGQKAKPSSIGDVEVIEVRPVEPTASPVSGKEMEDMTKEEDEEAVSGSELQGGGVINEAEPKIAPPPPQSQQKVWLLPELKEKIFERAKEITSPDGYINTDPLTIQELVGKKVILIDFWTYSCINCQRTFPYLRAWHEKYKDQGLEIIGIHTPEFEFEKDYDNVQKATERFNLNFPVVLDNDFSTWHAYRNRYWPRKYLIDIDGFIVYDHIGEGAYEETEKKIQEALEERMDKLGIAGEIEKSTAEVEGEESSRSGKRYSPETYFGFLRNTSNGSGVKTFEEPSSIQPNRLYFVGDWNITPEYAESLSPNAKIIYKYQASKVFLVGSSAEGSSGKISKDGSAVGKDGQIYFQDERLYHIIDDEYGEHVLEITIFDPGFRAFAFTFG